jgi:hypothetical protein
VGIADAPDPRWSINGGFVALENDTGTLASCAFLAYPCLKYKLVSMGLNATRVGGRRVILATDFNLTSTGLPLMMTETHQVNDSTTPAGVPNGQSAPPLPPELVDMTAPVVTTSTPSLTFSLGAPAPLTAAFNLSAPFPLKWIVTLINEPEKTNVDLTGGIPPNVTLTPTGGVWNSPSISLKIDMTQAFLSGLAKGFHRIFVTGVSKRGLSGHKDARIEVTL